MKILVVGGAGYVGGYLTDQLFVKGYDVTVYDSLVYEKRYLKKIEFIFGDVRDREKLSKIVNNFDVIVWLAAIVGDGACAKDPFLSQSINEDAVKWLVDNYKGKIIFPSTCSVYGINNELIDETAAPNPLSIYAKTKLAAEQYIVKNCSNYLIFRLGTLYGLGDEHSRIRLDLVVNVLAKRAVRGEKLRVFGGEQWRPLLHVKDVSTAVLFGISRNINGLYNLCDNNLTIRQIADGIRTFIPNAVIEYQELKFEDQRNYRVISNKFLNTGWIPRYSLADGISEIKAAIEQHRIKNTEDPDYSNEAYLGENYKSI